MTTTGPSAPERLTLEHHVPDALGIGTRRPRLSWVVAAAPEGYRQARYEVRGRVVRADGSPEEIRHRVEGGEQVLVPWPGRGLASREAVTVQVRVQGASGPWSPWSTEASAEVGLLEPSDWSAVLVGPADAEQPPSARRPPLIRGRFEVPDSVRSARLYVTAHGVFEVEVNGRRVGEDVLAPGWTSYRHRLRYLTYDVTDHLRGGENVLGAWLADGWYRGHLGFDGGRWNVFGDDVGLLAQLEVVTDAGRVVVLTSDESWRTAPGPIISAQLYEGEAYDGRLEQHGWSSPGFDDTAWSPVRRIELDGALLVAPHGPPVRCTEELAPAHILEREPGRYLLDFGQNHAGRLRVRVAGPAGTTIRLRHAEVLEDGELCTRPLRGATSTDVLILDGGGEREWEPRFTMHGFRYAEISGWPGELRPGDVVSRVHHSDMPRRGWFWCSEPDVERLHENVVWSMRSNFVDVPTDCPQRDERFGWTGDMQVFAPTASFLYGVNGVLDDWLRSLAAEQEEYGTVPWYVPYVPSPGWDPTVPGALWGDAAVLVPWTLYERTGDTGVLRQQYASARAWVDQVESLAGPDRLWDSGFQLGDWLDPTAPPDDPAQAVTDPYLVATAYFAYSARRLAETADVLGEADDARRYRALADEVRDAFAKSYLAPDAPGDARTQTACSLALALDLCPDEPTRERVGEMLAALVRTTGGTISTGFAGTPAICDALSGSGHLAEAYTLLLERRCPSWLYAVTMGATTVWERWDSILPDGSVNPGDMTSFNHYALGAVADWMHRVVAGLAPDAPGYRRIRFAPRPGGGITSAGARHETPYGTAAIDWRCDDGHVTVRLRVPVGTTAVLDLPGLRRQLGHGVHDVTHRLPA
ncbi:glycoside hydrolase family 78 protein [Jiangella gansuensis]|uniref:glycoside hydrolase family 78 protein n=1 Tax=Jiangella gansuensis TaxID=281473 RepID=UPI0004B32CBA|nr:glycoside hydrolase family 78 protein [Jiangella gansuensis]